MKNIKYLVLGLIALGSFNACTDDDQLIFTSQPDPEGVSFANSFSSVYILSDETRDNLAERFTWQTPDYGVDTPVTYEVQGSASAEFGEDDTILLGSTTEGDLPITVSKMLELANEAGLDTDPETFVLDEEGEPVLDEEGEPVQNNFGEVFVRLKTIIGSNNGEPMFSEIQPLVLSIIETPVDDSELPFLYVIGNFLSDGGYGPNWEPSVNLPKIASTGRDNFEYEGFINFQGTGIEYKFLPQETGASSFDGDYGDTGDSNGSFSGTLEQEGEVNCGLPTGEEPGYFYVKADLSDLENITYSLEKASWALVGGATPLGWPDGGTEGQPGNDHDMTYNSADAVWEITINLIVGEYKFRANDDWQLNLGPDTDGDGFMNFGGLSNFSVDEAGEYKVILDLSNPRKYTHSIEKL